MAHHRHHPQSGRVVEVAEALVHDLVHNGPASKTGLCGRMRKPNGQAFGYNVRPYFEDALNYARMNLLADHGKPIVYSHDTDQYGFPDDLVSAEAYILRFNLRYLVTRAETMMEQSRLAVVQHGPSADLAAFQHVAGAFALAGDALGAKFDTSPRTQRGAVSTGAQAKVFLQP